MCVCSGILRLLSTFPYLFLSYSCPFPRRRVFLVVFSPTYTICSSQPLAEKSKLWSFSMVKRHLLLGRKAVTNLDSMLKCRDITLPTKVHLVKAMVFPVVIYGWELDYKESWVQKNWCFWTVVLERTLESPLDCMGIQPVHPKENLSWIFIGSIDAEAETPMLWPSESKNRLIWKDPDAGKDWRREKGIIEDEMVGWHHWLDGHEFE